MPAARFEMIEAQNWDENEVHGLGRRFDFCCISPEVLTMAKFPGQANLYML